MGIDIDGGMIVGRKLGEIDLSKLSEEIQDEINNEDFIEDNGMLAYAPWYDAEYEYCTVGFEVVNAVDATDEAMEEFVNDVMVKADKFKNIFGCDAKLVGMQRVW